jgi:hypothetical protein
MCRITCKLIHCFKGEGTKRDENMKGIKERKKTGEGRLNDPPLNCSHSVFTLVD